MSKNAVLYIHGKGGNAKEADMYKKNCQNFDVYGVDYQELTPWSSKEIIISDYEKLIGKYDGIIIIANSIGAYFAMNALQGKAIKKALFISPIVNMERLILDMLQWSNVSEQELKEKQTIETAFGETLSFQYLSYVRDNPITWSVPTEILYAGQDNLTSKETITAFAKAHNAGLTVMAEGEHWFHTPEQLAFLDKWMIEKIGLEN